MIRNLILKPIFTAMKTLNWIGWISFGIGILVILLAGISLLTGKNLFGFVHLVNYFQTASTFFLLTISLFIFVYRCECKK
jgi:hypothetical protein